jgi:hypothetical protein
MASFHELTQKLTAFRHRRAVLLALVSTLDRDFIATGPAPAKFSIKTDEGDIVPESEVEKVSEDLADQIRAVETQISGIMSSNLQEATATPPPAPPATVATEPPGTGTTANQAAQGEQQ